MSNSQELEIQDTIGSAPCRVRPGRRLRHIQGRRSVYEALADGKPVILKIFSSRLHGRRHFRRERRGFQRLAQRGIPTATVLAGGTCADGWALVLQTIENAVDVFTLFEGLPDREEKKRIGLALFDLLAQMHKTGIIQRDLHLGNFLWDGRQIYAMDPAQMTFHSKPVGKKQSLKQAGDLLTGFLPLDPEEKKDLLEVYFQRRQWVMNDTLWEQLETAAQKTQIADQRKGLRKTLRNTRRFILCKKGDWRGVFVRSAFDGIDLADFMAGLDTAMEAGQVLKRGNTCFVCRIGLRGREMVVKRYNHKGLWHSIRHTIKGSRARKCWLLGHWLTGLKIPCARPLAFLEQRRFGLIRQSYILNEFIEGPDIRRFLQTPKLSEQTKQSTIENTEALLDQLVKYGITHGDPKPSNFLINSNNQPILIDLDSLSTHRLPFIGSFYAEKMKTVFRRRLFENL